MTSAHVHVSGLRVGQALTLESSSSVQTLSSVVPNTFDEQPTLVILVTFQDNPTRPYTPTYGQDVVFGLHHTGSESSANSS